MPETPKTVIVILKDGDTALIRGANLTRRVTDDPRSETRIDNRRGPIQPLPTETVQCQPGDPLPPPPPDPDPDPPPVEPPPGTDPPPDGTVNRLPGLRGPDLLSKSEQSPEKYWDVHAPRPVAPPGAENQWLYQMDLSDAYHTSPWSPDLPSTAWVRVSTLFGLPSHGTVRLKWPVAHHLEVGSLDFKLEGRNDPSGPWSLLKDKISITDETPGDKRLRYPIPVDIPVQNGGYQQYRVTATGTIADPGDAGVFGAPDLTLH